MLGSVALCGPEIRTSDVLVFDMSMTMSIYRLWVAWASSRRSEVKDGL